MNKILSILLIAAIATGCLSKKTAQKSPSDPASQPKVFSVPETATEPAKKPVPPPSKPVTTPTQPKAEEKPIAVKKEQVSFTQPTDKSQNEANTYFVILGSFSQLENAKNYRETLVREGFTPIILHSETGYYRICSNSFKTETEARSRISQIRSEFPKYSDVWLLIKE
jgi:cell division protein FtsN